MKKYERKITQKQTEKQKYKTRQYKTEQKSKIPNGNRQNIQELMTLHRTREKSKKATDNIRQQQNKKS